MKITAEPRSDQINADDFVGSPRTFTIAGVRQGTAEQKYDIMLAEVEGRVWRPPPTVVRILIEVWGDESDDWIGKRVTLYRDPNVMVHGSVVGGIRISHMSNLPDGKALKVKVTAKRGKRELITVQPLVEQPTPTEPSAEQVAACKDPQQLRAWWKVSGPERKAQIEARSGELNGGAS